MGTGCFRYEPRRLGYRELSRIVRGQGTPVLMWIMKTLGISWRSAWARKYPTSIREWIATPNEVSQQTAAGLAAARGEVTTLGFEPVAILGQKDCLYPMAAATELYRHASGQAIVLVTCTRSGTIARTTVTATTGLQDGRVLETTNRKDFDSPPEFSAKEVFNASPAQVWHAHQARLTGAGGAALTIADNEAALDFQQRNEQASWDSLIKRRVMVECTPEEVERAQRRLEAVRGFGDGAGPNAAVMMEMLHAMERKQSRQEVMWAFGVTLVLFVLVGFVWWEPKMLWMLVLALIIHETGHYVTMRLFGYRNLRMVFVPLGGAAVIGQNFNVPGWKKAIVSLMGPLPGILIALMLGIVMVFQGRSELRFDVGLMFLILNALNLLPIFPLDGGAYLNAILFCRNAKIEVVFKALAFTAMAIAAFAMRDFILGAFAYFLFLGLMPSYRLARKTEELRREIEVPAVNDPNELAVEIKNRVIDGVKEALRKPASAKTVAAHALGMFERLNARPPGVLGTVVLLGVYAVTFVLALLAAAGLGSGARREKFEDVQERAASISTNGATHAIFVTHGVGAFAGAHSGVKPARAPAPLR